MMDEGERAHVTKSLPQVEPKTCNLMETLGGGENHANDCTIG
jgi:hypothetical protein